MIKREGVKWHKLQINLEFVNRDMEDMDETEIRRARAKCYAEGFEAVNEMKAEYRRRVGLNDYSRPEAKVMREEIMAEDAARAPYRHEYRDLKLRLDALKELTRRQEIHKKRREHDERIRANKRLQRQGRLFDAE